MSSVVVSSVIQQKYVALKSALGTPVGAVIPLSDGWYKQTYTNVNNQAVTGTIYYNANFGVFAVYGAIYVKYVSLGAEKSFLGYPLTDELVTPDGVGRFNHFQGGSIYWTPSTGAREVHGEIKAKWAALGWEKSFLGYPTTDELTTPDKIGRYNHFQGGSIYWTPTTGANVVCGEIRDEWERRGWEQGSLGYPIADTTGTPTTTLTSKFQNGIITWNKTTGYNVTLTTTTTTKMVTMETKSPTIVDNSAESKVAAIKMDVAAISTLSDKVVPQGIGQVLVNVASVINKKYNENKDVLGTSDGTLEVLSDGWYKQKYKNPNGAIYYQPSNNNAMGYTYIVYGAIYVKYVSLGAEKSFLGYPITDECTTPDTVGRYTHFQGGSIYWTPATGAYAVRIEIRDEWARRGWEKGSLGYPTADTTGTPTTTLTSKFQGGTIVWSQTLGYTVSLSFGFWSERKLVQSTSLHRTSHGPAMAEYNGKLYMAWKGMDSDERIWFSWFDGSTWSEQQSLVDRRTSCGPALAVFNKKLYMAWKGTIREGNVPDNRIWYSSFDGSTWSTPIVAKSGSDYLTSHGPALAVCKIASSMLFTTLKEKLFMTWKNATNNQIYFSSFDGSTWSKQEEVINGTTSHGPALATYNGKLFMAWKNQDNEKIRSSSYDFSISGTSISYNWSDAVVVAVSSSCGPALVAYSKYWVHAKSYDPCREELYMVWKNVGDDAIIRQSTFYSGDKKWTGQKLTSRIMTTSDTPALAVFNGKLYMAWKDQGTGARIYFSHLDLGLDNPVRNIFEKTRPGTPVVRPDDLAVLRIETQNMKITPGNTPLLQKAIKGREAYLIIHLPPQSFAEQTFYQTKDDHNEQPLPPPIRARIAHESRLVFTVPDNFDIEYSLAGVLKACQTLNLKVSTACDNSTTSSSVLSNIITSSSLSSSISASPIGVSPVINSSVSNFSVSSSTSESLLGSGLRRPELPNAVTTSIEMPWRLIISPQGDGCWRHSNFSALSNKTMHTELWHSRLATRHNDGLLRKKVIESPYPDEKRTLRAIWALSGIGTEMATNKDGKPAPMQSEWLNEDTLPISYKPTDQYPFRTTLDNSDRYQFVHLSSHMTSFYKPEPIDTNMMMLSALGGWLDSRGAWDLARTGLSVEEWVHRATMGRDHYVRVVKRGFLFPFGHRVSLVKISERKFNNDTKGNVAYLHQRSFLIIREKERTFDDNLFHNIKDGDRFLDRKFPFKSIKLLTEITPDLSDQSKSPSAIQNGYYGDKMFWPSVSVNGKAERFRFQCVATDLDERRVLFELPMIFVDNTLTAPISTDTGKPNFGQAEQNAKEVMDEYNNITNKKDTVIDFGWQRVALAPSLKSGDTSVQVKSMRFSGFTKENILQGYSEDLTRPVWVPQVDDIEAKIDSIVHLSGASNSHKLTFHEEYLIRGSEKGGFDHTKGIDNKGEVFVKVVSGPSIDFSSQGDKSGGFIQPNLKPAALSRLAGPVMSNNVTDFINGTIEEGAGFPNKQDAENLELSLPLLFGCIPLGELIPKVNDDIAGCLERAPKFISEVGTKVESFLSDMDRLNSFVTDLPKQSVNIAKAALTAFYATLDDLLEQAKAYNNQPQVTIVENAVKTVKANIIGTDQTSPSTTSVFTKLNILTYTAPAPSELTSLSNSISNACIAVDNLKGALASGLPANFRQSGLNAACKLETLLKQIPSPQLPDQLPKLMILGTTLQDKLDELKDIINGSKPVTESQRVVLKNALDNFKDALNGADLLDGAPRNSLRSALNAVQDIVEHSEALAALTGDELTIRFDWNPPIESWPKDSSKSLFRVRDKKGLLVAVEAKVKKNGSSSSNISVNCSLKHFDLVLVAPKSFLELNFEKVEFSVDSAAKMDVDVLLSDVKFVGPLSFVETLRDLIPLNGFSDPPYLDISSKGIDAGYNISLPSLQCGMFNLSNISLGAGFTVPFIAQPLSVRFNFCRREQPFMLTVCGLGGGGFFGITISPEGVQIMEAALEFGAALYVNLGVASGGVHIMAGIYFRMEKIEAVDALSLTGYLRMGGHVSVLGLITASLELYLALTYEFHSGKCVGQAQLTVKISLFFFKKSVTIYCERKFAGSNGDPTLRQMLGHKPELPLEEELTLINDDCEYAWREYIESFTFEETA